MWFKIATAAIPATARSGAIDNPQSRAQRAQHERSVVVVAYFFPPTGGVSVARALKLARYLPRHSWRPTVVAPRSTGHFAQDNAGLADIPADVAVVRTR